jgi:chromosome segregation ATPase
MSDTNADTIHRLYAALGVVEIERLDKTSWARSVVMGLLARLAALEAALARVTEERDAAQADALENTGRYLRWATRCAETERERDALQADLARVTGELQAARSYATGEHDRALRYGAERDALAARLQAAREQTANAEGAEREMVEHAREVAQLLAEARDDVEQRDLSLAQASEDLTRERTRGDEAARQVQAAREVLREMVDWFGGKHEEDCPKDDTCHCAGKPLNDKIEAALAPPEGAGKKA